ncbi:hypothetical protein R6Q59_012395 [Mikania micrantha]
MSRSLGIPVKLLHEAAGHIVTVELKSGEVYRGSMIECEDNWNCQLENITFTAKDGKVAQLEHIFIRGSKVRFMIIPDMLKNAPMFKRLEARIKGKGSALGVGRGRAVAMRARVSISIVFTIFLKQTFKWKSKRRGAANGENGCDLDGCKSNRPGRFGLFYKHLSCLFYNTFLLFTNVLNIIINIFLETLVKS